MVQAPGLLPDIIVSFRDVGPMEHHDAGLTYPQYIAKRYGERGLGLVPDLDEAIAGDDFEVGSLEAFISSGQWVVSCVICNAAVLADDGFPYFICPNCGSPPNKKWYRVDFPAHATGIEQQLLRMPGYRTASPMRNWDFEPLVKLRGMVDDWVRDHPNPGRP